MIKIGLTGSISSGKTTACKLIAKKRGPIFSADKTVKKLYLKKKIQNKISKKLKFNNKINFKKNLKNSLFNTKKTLQVLESIIHPLVRKEMFYFLKKNKNRKFLFLEIPLLVESKLQRFFDVTIFIKSRKNLRKIRYKNKGGNLKIFNILDNHQLKDSHKMKLCDYTVTNNGSFNTLKKNLLKIINKYE